MTRLALEHLLRAAAAVSDERDIVVIGSQAILGQFPDAPARLLVSIEADVYPLNAPEKSDVIDGAIAVETRLGSVSMQDARVAAAQAHLRRMVQSQ